MSIKHTIHGDILLGLDDLSNNYLDKDENYLWDSHLKSTYDNYVNKSSVVIDVGANIGSHTILLGKKAKKIYAFEPQRFIYYQLCGNLFINNLINVEAYNLACYDRECYMHLTLGEPNYLEKHYSATLGLTVSDKKLIKAIKLDNFIEERIDLIKIDTQGSDLQVIKGAEQIITKYKPIIIFEIEDGYLLAPHNTTKNDYFDYLKSINYSVNNVAYSDYVATPN